MFSPPQGGAPQTGWLTRLGTDSHQSKMTQAGNLTIFPVSPSQSVRSGECLNTSGRKKEEGLSEVKMLSNVRNYTKINCLLGAIVVLSTEESTSGNLIEGSRLSTSSKKVTFFFLEGGLCHSLALPAPSILRTPSTCVYDSLVFTSFLIQTYWYNLKRWENIF